MNLKTLFSLDGAIFQKALRCLVVYPSLRELAYPGFDLVGRAFWPPEDVLFAAPLAMPNIQAARPKFQVNAGN